MPVRNENRGENRQRLLEIMEVMRRHEIVKGITPEKLCAIIEELGPTFIKLGQILSMRSDILPAAYCDALKKLRSSVAPMPYEQIAAIVEKSYGRPLEEDLQCIEYCLPPMNQPCWNHSIRLPIGKA